MDRAPRILATGIAFPEGPAFAPDGSLWCVELRAGNLVHWEGGKAVRIACGGEPNGLAFDPMGTAWFCDAGHGAIRSYEPISGKWNEVVTEIDGAPLARPNDLAFDATGNLLFTCPGDSRFEPEGYVCCLRPDGTLRRIASEMYFPNGLLLTADGGRLIVAETYARRLWIGEWDPLNSEWRNPRPWSELGQPTGPDGMALGANGMLYVAVYRSGQIRVVDQHGEVVDAIDLPGQNPTNCAFDPSGDLGLVVTEAEEGLLLSLSGLGPGVDLFARDGAL